MSTDWKPVVELVKNAGDTGPGDVSCLNLTAPSKRRLVPLSWAS